jgi:hypothetical protein
MMITRIDGRILGFSLPESWALLVLIAAGPPGAPVFEPLSAQLVRGVRQLMRRGVRIGTVGGRHHHGHGPRRLVLLSAVEIMPSKAQKCVRSRPTGGYLE